MLVAAAFLLLLLLFGSRSTESRASSSVSSPLLAYRETIGDLLSPGRQVGRAAQTVLEKKEA